MNVGKNIFSISPVYISFFLLFFLCISLVAKNIDSLHEKLESVVNSEKIGILIELTKEYHYTDLSKSREMAKKAVNLCQRFDDRENLAISLKYIALSYHFQGHLDSAFYYYNRSVLFELENKDYEQVADSYNNIGLINIAWHYPKLAISFLEKALGYYLKTGSKDHIGRAHNNLGVAYKRMEKYDKALEHFTKSLKIYIDENDRKGIAATNINIGTILLKIQSYKKSY